MTKHSSSLFILLSIFLCCFPFPTETGEVKKTSFPRYLSALQRESLLTVTDQTLFTLENIPFRIPLEGVNIEDFLDRSIGYVPPDLIRDGLPAFGTQRDDWKGAPRPHEGYDIYIDKANVIAASEGIVSKVAITSKAGLYVKIQHDHHLATVYVHLKDAVVKRHQKVQAGEMIGYIDGPTGNAISSQLHFEIQKNSQSLDPLPLIESYYAHDSQILLKINRYQRILQENEKERAKKVKEFLQSH